MEGSSIMGQWPHGPSRAPQLRVQGVTWAKQGTRVKCAGAFWAEQDAAVESHGPHWIPGWKMQWSHGLCKTPVK